MSDGILEIIKKRSKKRRLKIAIGAGPRKQDYEKVFEAAKAVNFADAIVVCRQLYACRSDVECIVANDVEEALIRLLMVGDVDAIVRGTCDASAMMKVIRAYFKPKIIGRIGLLETAVGQNFFFTPVGIDEGNTVEERVFLIKEGIKLAARLGVELKIGVLGGGRKSDVGRHKTVDMSISEAEKIVDIVKKDGFSNIMNYHILIEDSIADKSNFIIAPNGITGNLIFRTLAFLGGGRGYGAPLLGLNKVIVDTSRAGLIEDYVIAMMMASALVE